MAIDLKTGYSFRFKNKTWKVTEYYNIRWKDGTQTKEYKIKSDIGQINYLEIEIDNTQKPKYSFWETIHNKKDFLNKTQENIGNDSVSIGKAKFPKRIKHNGVLFIFDEQNDGTCHYEYDEDEKVNCLEYTTEDDTQLLSIELWDDEIEIATGYPISEHEISNIKESTYLSSYTSSSYDEHDGNNRGCLLYIVAGIICLVFMLISRACDDKTTNNHSRIYHSGSSYRGRSSGFGK